MTRLSQIILARRALALKLAHQRWIQEPSCPATVALLRATAALCRELAVTLHELAVHNRSAKVPNAEELVATTTLFSVMADTSLDCEAVQVFQRHHLLGLPGSFRCLEQPLTPGNLSISVEDEVALLDSYCQRTELDQVRAFGLLRSFCELGDELGSEVYRLAPGLHTAEVAVLARTALRNCFAYC
jgi:hypothetical protein